MSHKRKADTNFLCPKQFCRISASFGTTNSCNYCSAHLLCLCLVYSTVQTTAFHKCMIFQRFVKMVYYIRDLLVSELHPLAYIHEET